MELSYRTRFIVALGAVAIIGGCSPSATHTPAPKSPRPQATSAEHRACTVETQVEFELQVDGPTLVATDSSAPNVDLRAYLAGSPSQAMIISSLKTFSNAVAGSGVVAANQSVLDTAATRCAALDDPLLTRVQVSYLQKLGTQYAPFFPTPRDDAAPLSDVTAFAPSQLASTPVSAPPTAIAPAEPAPTGLGNALSVTGNDGQLYNLTLWGSSAITDCAAHAYGQPVVSYLRAHPCTSALRRLATTLDDTGNPAVVSVVTVTFGGHTQNSDETAPGSDYNLADGLVKLENASGTGGMNDLLREGDRIGLTDAPTSIPSGEVFDVSREDATVRIYDTFYSTGPTSDSDPTLKALISALDHSEFDSPGDPGSTIGRAGTATPGPASGDAAATEGCQEWRALEKNPSVDGADQNLFQGGAAQQAESGGPKWASLAGAMRYEASLPSNGLTKSQLKTASADSKVIISRCSTLGVKIPY